MVNYLSWTWVSIAGFAFSLSFFPSFSSESFIVVKMFAYPTGRERKKINLSHFYTKLQGGWQNSSLNALWCCLFERSEPSPALWSGFPAHMPLQMLFSLVPTSSPSFSVSFYFYLLCHSWDPPVAVACPPGSFVKLRPLCFEVLQHDQYEVESGSWSVYCCVFTVKVHVIMGRR